MRNGRKKSLLDPIKQNLVERLSNTDVRIRRKMLRVLVVLVGLFLFYCFFSGSYGFIRIAKLHLQKSQLEERNHQLLVNLVDAELTRNRLHTDMKYIEHIARSRHYFSRPGEVIYRFKQ
nr:septum formation initiator family protein [candidate division Zixibacteria bacterium]